MSVSSPPPAKPERRNSMQMVVEVAEIPLDLVTRVGRFCSRTLLDMMLDANSGGIGLTLSNPERPELYWVVLGYYVLFFVANGILIWQLTISTVSSRFLSLGTSDGVTQVCAEVPKVVTGTFQGDVFGRWETDPLFQKNSSAFVLEFRGSSVGSADYRRTMETFRKELKALRWVFSGPGSLSLSVENRSHLLPLFTSPVPKAATGTPVGTPSCGLPLYSTTR